MSDTNQEFEEYPELQASSMPDFNQLLAKKVQTIKTGGFDPHQLMVQKKQAESGESVNNTPNQEWPEKDVKALEDFCAKYGIMGFNCGKMSPIAALALLKGKMGIVDAPLEERVPYGYEKAGTRPLICNQSYPYLPPVSKKVLLTDNAEEKTTING